MLFLMTHWRTILLIYTVIGGLVFLGVLFLFIWASYSNDQEEDQFCDDYYYPNKAPSPIISGLTLGLIAGLACGILWPFIPLLLFGVWLLDLTAKKFPSLMGHMADDKEGGTKNGTHRNND